MDELLEATRATDLAGGFQAWREAGLPVAGQPLARKELGCL